MTIQNPHMLPKVRSKKLMADIQGMPCTLRIASFIGLPCAPDATCVGCHLPVFGKGVNTKTSDLYVVSGCATCHDLIDGRDRRIDFIQQKYPAALVERMLMAMCETQARHLMLGNIIVPDGRMI